MSLESRYWSKVDVRGEDDCWLWVASTQRGYGQISGRGRLLKAHRLAWEFANGKPVPAHLVVMHLCDNPLCQNPRHLRLGTRKENSQDAASKGRFNRKLTIEKVLAIRERLARGEGCAPLSREYGVAYSTISRIQEGRYWANLAREEEAA